MPDPKPKPDCIANTALAFQATEGILDVLSSIAGQLETVADAVTYCHRKRVHGGSGQSSQDSHRETNTVTRERYPVDLALLLEIFIRDSFCEWLNLIARANLKRHSWLC